jgi:hypothetical protein
VRLFIVPALLMVASVVSIPFGLYVTRDWPEHGASLRTGSHVSGNPVLRGNFTPAAVLDASQVMSASESRITHLLLADDAMHEIAAEFVSPRDPDYAITCSGIEPVPCYAEKIERN